MAKETPGAPRFTPYKRTSSGHGTRQDMHKRGGNGMCSQDDFNPMTEGVYHGISGDRAEGSCLEKGKVVVEQS